MRIVREGQWTRLALLVGVFVAAAQACSLNPQPIPPGAEGSEKSFTSDASASARGDSASMPPAQGADSGSNEDMDASPPNPALDGGLDGLDGATDAPTDAPDDAPTDAPTDTGSD